MMHGKGPVLHHPHPQSQNLHLQDTDFGAQLKRRDRKKTNRSPQKIKSNVQVKLGKSPSGKVVVHIHGIPKAVVKNSFQVSLVWRQIFGF